MKNLFGYISWVWRNWELWQRSFIIGMMLQGASVFTSKPYDMILSAIGFGIIMFWLGKWWIVDMLMTSYKKYKQQQEDLFKTIKGN
jgi:Kef-type K+ transport system membrane component KefB